MLSKVYNTRLKLSNSNFPPLKLPRKPRTGDPLTRSQRNGGSTILNQKGLRQSIPWQLERRESMKALKKCHSRESGNPVSRVLTDSLNHAGGSDNAAACTVAIPAIPRMAGGGRGRMRPPTACILRVPPTVCRHHLPTELLSRWQIRSLPQRPFLLLLPFYIPPYPHNSGY